MNYSYDYSSPLGKIVLGSDGCALTGLWFEGGKYCRDTLKGEIEEKELDIFKDTAKWLDIYFSGTEPDFTPSLLLNGTPFRMKVWEILKTIPYGKIMTYGEIARKIAADGLEYMSARAVGGAVGHNPISIIVPCHRVIGADGSITGYAGGIDKKAALLKLESHSHL